MVEALPPKKYWFRQLPNQLTLARIAVIPVLLLLYPMADPATPSSFLKVLCALIFGLAALTDILDGYLARRNNEVTSIGALIDPLADKMLTATAFILLADANSIWTFVLGVLLCRDIGMSSLRMIAMEQGFKVGVNAYGKLKTIFQDIMIFCLLVDGPLFDIDLKKIGYACAFVALGLSIYSAYIYGLDFLEKSKNSEQNP